MNALVFERVSDDWLFELSFRAEPGVTLIYGEPTPIGRILELAVGARRAKRGRVLLNDSNVTDPRVRARIAALLPEERLLALSTVQDAVRSTLALRGARVSASSVLEEAGLAELAARKPERLSALERRAVALSMALADPDVHALALFDPMATRPLVARSRLLDVCLERAQRIPVLIATPHLEDALVFGGRLFTFARGALYATPSERSDAGVALTVHSEEARKLASLLASHPSVQGVVFDAERTPFEVVVQSDDPEALAALVTQVACEHAIPITSLVAHAAPGRAPSLQGMPGIWVAPNNGSGNAAEGGLRGR